MQIVIEIRQIKKISNIVIDAIKFISKYKEKCFSFEGFLNEFEFDGINYKLEISKIHDVNETQFYLVSYDVKIINNPELILQIKTLEQYNPEMVIGIVYESHFDGEECITSIYFPSINLIVRYDENKVCVYKEEKPFKPYKGKLGAPYKIPRNIRECEFTREFYNQVEEIFLSEEHARYLKNSLVWPL